MGRIWQYAKKLGGRLALKILYGLGWVFFTLSCLAAMVVGLAILVRQVGAETPSAAVISAAGGLVLVSALFARHGEVIAARLKKLGPVELFEEVREALANLEEITLKVPVYTVSEDELEINPVKMKPRGEVRFRPGRSVCRLAVSRRHRADARSDAATVLRAPLQGRQLRLLAEAMAAGDRPPGPPGGAIGWRLQTAVGPLSERRRLLELGKGGQRGRRGAPAVLREG
jgi:hypothetical protein